MSDICRLQTTDCRLQIGDCTQWTSDHRLEEMLTDYWSQISKTAKLNSTQILDHVKEWVCVDSVTLMFTRRWPRKAYWGIITSRLAYSSMFFTIQKWKWTYWKMQVHFDMDAWCIITVCGISAFTVDTQFYRGELVFSGTVHVEGGCPS